MASAHRLLEHLNKRWWVYEGPVAPRDRIRELERRIAIGRRADYVEAPDIQDRNAPDGARERGMGQVPGPSIGGLFMADISTKIAYLLRLRNKLRYQKKAYKHLWRKINLLASRRAYGRS